MVFGKALQDNTEGGVVSFIDPSLADDFWKDRNRVQGYFENYGANNIQHYLMTTQEFVESDEYQALDNLGIVFIDGLHTEEQVHFDYEAFECKISENGLFLFHDSISIFKSRGRRLYSPEQSYERQVKYFIDKLKLNPQLQVFDFPFAKGLTLVRNIANTTPDFFIGNPNGIKEKNK